MSSASSASGLIREMELAQKDLAMYAAIIGCKPTMEPAEEAPAEPLVEAPAAEAEVEEEDHHPRRLSIWMRQVSHDAKKRFDEAKMRLAS
jgi:hypothetical protein